MISPRTILFFGNSIFFHSLYMPKCSLLKLIVSVIVEAVVKASYISE